MAIQKETIFLSNEDYETLATTGTVTIGTDTLTYSPEDTIYVTPDDLDLTNYIQKSSTAGFIKNDGTVGTPDAPDLTNYIQKSSTAGFIKNDGTVGTPDSLPSHTSSDAGKVLSINSSNTVIWTDYYQGEASGAFNPPYNGDYTES